MEKKEVSMAELFFDLVFVYVLSTINQTVQHVSQSLVSFESLGKNLVLFLVFYSIWVYHTLLINRFFEQKWYQYVFLFTDMFLILCLSKAINSNFQETFTPFASITGCIYVSLMVQYFLNHMLIRHRLSNRLIRVYLIGLGLTIIFFILGLVLPKNINFWFFLIGIIIAVSNPGVCWRASQQNPVFFSHLTERLSLFMILLFGEGIVQIVPTIKLSNFNVLDIVYFILIVSMFIIYSFHYKGSLDQEKTDDSGLITIYIHLFIIYATNIVFLIMHKALSAHPLSNDEQIGYTLAFCLFLFGIFIDTILHRDIDKGKKVYVGIILVATILGLVITNIHIITIVEISAILLLCGMYYGENKNILNKYL